MAKYKTDKNVNLNVCIKEFQDGMFSKAGWYWWYETQAPNGLFLHSICTGPFEDMETAVEDAGITTEEETVDG